MNNQNHDTLVSFVNSMVLNFSRVSAIGISSLAMSACGPSPEIEKLKAQGELLKSELAAVTSERNSFRDRLAELTNTPSVLLSKVTVPAGDGKLKDAEHALNTIKEKFPQTMEASEAQRLVDALRLKLDKQQEESRRLEALGFKALKTSPVVDTGGVKITVNAPRFSKQFTFDRYGDNYHLRDADRDNKFVVIGLTATAAKGVNDPDLPGFAIYWADGKNLLKIDTFDLRFVRWEDYATYLGNYGDSSNDFAKSATIPFSIGAQGSDELMAKRPLYVVATTKGCLGRQYERFKNPPVYYLGACAALEEKLSVESFSEDKGDLTVVRRID